MKLLIHLLLCVLPLNAKNCISDAGEKCLTKSQVGPYGVFMEKGDPCFLYKDARWCFVSPGVLNSCTCTAECGCQGNDAKPIASCPDTQTTYQKPDCGAQKAKYCPLGNDNTMCAYCGVDLESCSDGICKKGLNTEEMELILDKHNQLRSRVALGQQHGHPSATNMRKLIWSDELARIAQVWADQCPTYHDANRKSPNFTHQPGQNIAYSWSSAHYFKWDLEKKIQNWYDEVYNFPVENISHFSNVNTNGTIGHYSQLVWAETRHVGCGAIYNKDKKQAGYPYKKTLICNYHPPGNYLGQPVYLSGPPASNCSKGSQNGLCL